jgi:hypothetical protein
VNPVIKDFIQSLDLLSDILQASPLLDQASQERYIRQIIQLSVRWPDQDFHEYLYQTMIELGLENELLELAGPDLVPFLQSASREQSKVWAFL